MIRPECYAAMIEVGPAPNAPTRRSPDPEKPIGFMTSRYLPSDDPERLEPLIWNALDAEIAGLYLDREFLQIELTEMWVPSWPERVGYRLFGRQKKGAVFFTDASDDAGEAE